MWGKLQQPEKAFEYFNILLERHDIRPNVTTFTIIIDMYCKMQQIDKALEWFHKMTDEYDIEPNVATYNTIIGML
jgi:pentatricopeptide repeat protein